MLAATAFTMNIPAGASTGTLSATAMVGDTEPVDLSLRLLSRADRSSRPAASEQDVVPKARALSRPLPVVVAPQPAAAKPVPAPAPPPAPAPAPAATPTPKATTAKPKAAASQPAQSSESDEAAPAASGGISSAPCASGSAVERGVDSNAVTVHRAVCALFPSVRSYGGLRGSGDEHGSGHAIDIMIPSSSVGTQIANWVRANAGALGVSQVIWSQHIWTVQRGGEGWRSMSDRGSATANHYDHVHVTVY